MRACGFPCSALKVAMKPPFCCSFLRIGSISPGADLEDFGRNGGLAGAVVDTAQVFLEVFSVVRGGPHGGHAGRELRGHALLQHAQHLAVDVEGQDGVEDLHGVLLEDHLRGEHFGLDLLRGVLLRGELAVLGGQQEQFVAVRLDAARGERQQGADLGRGGDEGHELGVDDFDAVGVPGKVRAQEVLGHLVGLPRSRRLPHHPVLHHGRLPLLEVHKPLLPDRH
mmetsp:Transcript_9507/g.18696  ORF Transcript_9507/g.18696 Transcript_9507/m.18696 type:complete len:224 (+) Transcript_9507:232-903(+)